MHQKLASSSIYDAAFEYEISCVEDEENNYPQDALGIGGVLVQDLRSSGQSIYKHKEFYSGRTILPQLCVEFKRSIGHFLQEIYSRSGSSSKNPKVIDLLIVWDVMIPTSIGQHTFTLDPIYDDRRVFHSTTHRLGLIGSENTEIQCIVLKDVLNKYFETQN